MNQRRMTIAATACGIACAICIALFLLSVQNETNAARAEVLARYGGDQVEVCVATRDVYSGEKIDSSAIETRLWVADLLPEGAVRDSASVLGKTATSSILKGEVFCEKRFEASRNSLEIPSGKQAVSVPAKAVQAVGGAIRPGMSVDVYSSGDTTTAAIAHGVIVLDASVGDSGSLVSSGTGWITLAVDPEKVQEIIAASGKTSLYFVLPGDAPADANAGAAPAADANAGAASAASSGASDAKPAEDSQPQKQADESGAAQAAAEDHPSSDTAEEA